MNNMENTKKHTLKWYGTQEKIERAVEDCIREGTAPTHDAIAAKAHVSKANISAHIAESDLQTICARHKSGQAPLILDRMAQAAIADGDPQAAKVHLSFMAKVYPAKNVVALEMLDEDEKVKALTTEQLEKIRAIMEPGETTANPGGIAEPGTADGGSTA